METEPSRSNAVFRGGGENEPRTAFITGSSGGFGGALTRAFAARGWNVAASMRSPSQADPQLTASANVRVVPLDVTEPDSVTEAVACATDRFGAIDVLVNNAGYAQHGSLEEVSLDQMRAQFETNVFGVMAVTKAVLPQMRGRQRGHIINVSSLGGVCGLPTLLAYSSSKFALEGMSESLSGEVAGFGIIVTIVEPAALDTEFGAAMAAPQDPMPEYESAVAALFAFDRYETGDLRRAADAVVEIAGNPAAPLRLIVGHGLSPTRKKLAAQLDEYSAWEELTRTTL